MPARYRFLPELQAVTVRPHSSFVIRQSSFA
jgi:hypothetical protein